MSSRLRPLEIDSYATEQTLLLNYLTLEIMSFRLGLYCYWQSLKSHLLHQNSYMHWNLITVLIWPWRLEVKLFFAKPLMLLFCDVSLKRHLLIKRTIGQCTELRFANFLSGGFTTMAVINPPEKKLEKRTSLQCSDHQIKGSSE